MTSFHNKNDIIVCSWYMMWPSNLGVLVLYPQASDVDDVCNLASLVSSQLAGCWSSHTCFTAAESLYTNLIPMPGSFSLE